MKWDGTVSIPFHCFPLVLSYPSYGTSFHSLPFHSFPSSSINRNIPSPMISYHKPPIHDFFVISPPSLTLVLYLLQPLSTDRILFFFFPFLPSLNFGKHCSDGYRQLIFFTTTQDRNLNPVVPVSPNHNKSFNVSALIDHIN